MVSVRPRDGHTHDPHRGADQRSVITNARESASDDLARRQKRYFIAMAFRVACFVAMVFVPGWGRWVLLGIAVVIPTIAVTFANQADRRDPHVTPVPTATPSEAPELTIGESDIIPGETIPDQTGPDQTGPDAERDGPRMPGAA